MKAVKYIVARGRPSLMVPGRHMDYCDQNKYPVIVVWERTVRADVTWLNEPFQWSHGWLWELEDFRQDIEERAGVIFKTHETFDRPVSTGAITASFMTLYDLEINAAHKAAVELFDMTLAIICEYEERRVTP